jgi:hypothetical protein
VTDFRTDITLDFGFSPDHLRMLLRILTAGAIMLALALFQLGLRVSIDQVTKDVRSYEAQARLAESWNERLMLDLEARRSAEHLEAAALALGLAPATRVESLHVGRGE